MKTVWSVGPKVDKNKIIWAKNYDTESEAIQEQEQVAKERQGQLIGRQRRRIKGDLSGVDADLVIFFKLWDGEKFIDSL